MGKKEQKRRIAKDIVNYGISDKYNRTVNSHVKYRDIIDDPDRCVKEITMAALKYNWLMTVGETIKESINQDEHTNENDVKLWEQKGYKSAKEMALRIVEDQGRYSLNFDNPYYDEPY